MNPHTRRLPDFKSGDVPIRQAFRKCKMALPAGLEPTTIPLTVERSTIELKENMVMDRGLEPLVTA